MAVGFSVGTFATLEVSEVSGATGRVVLVTCPEMTVVSVVVGVEALQTALLMGIAGASMAVAGHAGAAAVLSPIVGGEALLVISFSSFSN